MIDADLPQPTYSMLQGWQSIFVLMIDLERDK